MKTRPTLFALCAGMILASGAMADPITSLSGSITTSAYDNASAPGGVLAATKNMATTSSLSVGGSSASSTMNFTHSSLLSTLRFDVSHQYGSQQFSSAIFETSITFTTTSTVDYTFSGTYNTSGTHISLFSASLDPNASSFIYAEADESLASSTAHVLDNVGTVATTGLRTGTIGPGTYRIRLTAGIGSYGVAPTSGARNASGSFVLEFEQDAPLIPLPGSAAMAMVGLGVVGLRRRRS